MTPEEIRAIEPMETIELGGGSTLTYSGQFTVLREIAAHLAEQNAILRDLKITGTITAIFAPPEVKP